MDDGKFPTYDILFQPTIDALHTHMGEASNGQIYDYVVQSLALSPHIAKRPHKDRSDLTELEYRLMWSRTYLRKFGLIDSPRRGWWVLTEIGRSVESVDRREIVRAVRGQAQGQRKHDESQAQLFHNETASEINGDEALSGSAVLRSPTPLLPTYANARHFLRVIDQVPASAYLRMINAILDQTGNPQNQVDWTQPNEWIPERLQGEERELAMHIWRSSRQELNPRHTRGCWYFASRHGLLLRGANDALQVTDRGRSFIDATSGPVVTAIDDYEGLLMLLRLVAEQGVARRSTLLPTYSEYSRTQTTFQSENALKSSLYYRLRNLVDRGFVASRGTNYVVTDAGLAWLELHAMLPTVQTPDELTRQDKSADLIRFVSELRTEARDQLRAYLFEMNAFKFEELIHLLLQEMGYENVTTTSSTNDKGVDVLGTIKMGISSVLEVVQVKRHRGSIGRPVLDQLRGSFYRFNAMRGTIISTGTFSKGAKDAAFERGAPPITLIDGEALLDLLLEYKIGVHKRQVDYYEFAPEKLVQFQVSDD
jgi:restriction system protein